MIKFLLPLLVLITAINLQAQKQSYNALYKIKFEKSDKLNSNGDKISVEATKNIENALEKAENLISFNLIFDKKSSLFTKEVIMNTDVNHLTSVVANTINPDTYYTNIVDNQRLKVTKIYDKTFIVNVNKIYAWKITKETKNILGYTCYKATLTEENINTNKNYIVEAWFSKEIPYYFGPNEYSGLPGLILELKLNDKQTLYCTNLNLEIKENKLLKKPVEGHYINSKKEFATIANKLVNDIKKQY